MEGKKKRLFMDEGKTKTRSLCGKMFNPDNELFQKHYKNLCQNCDRKEEAFNLLWVKYDYCMMGYPYEQLYKSMSAKEVKERLKEEIEGL